MPNITEKSGLRYYTSLIKGYFEELFNAKVDPELNAASKNPVQNSAVTTEINKITNRVDIALGNVSSVKKTLADHEQRIAAMESIVDKIQKARVSLVTDNDSADTASAKDTKEEV